VVGGGVDGHHERAPVATYSSILRCTLVWIARSRGPIAPEAGIDLSQNFCRFNSTRVAVVATATCGTPPRQVARVQSPVVCGRTNQDDMVKRCGTKVSLGLRNQEERRRQCR
jgi:hypothetical protein